MRDRKFQCCQSPGWNKDNHQEVDGSGSHEADLNPNDRCFTWRDAKWPWCWKLNWWSKVLKLSCFILPTKIMLSDGFFSWICCYCSKLILWTYAKFPISTTRFIWLISVIGNYIWDQYNSSPFFFWLNFAYCLWQVSIYILLSFLEI